MGQRTPLKLRQVRGAFRLIGEIRELGHDPDLWRPHLAAGLRALVGAQICTSSELPMPLKWTAPEAGAVAVGFSSEVQRQQLAAASARDVHGYNPLSPAVARLRNCSYTYSRRQLVDDRTWYGSPWVNHHPRQMGLDDSLLSHQVLSQFNCIHSIWLHRKWGDRLFTAAEVRLLHLFHGELARLWRRSHRIADAGVKGPDVQSLSPRLRQTLDGLLEGRSEKQIAMYLGLSQHTVHKYVGMLHRRFDVCSNGEMLALFLPRVISSHPRLATELLRA